MAVRTDLHGCTGEMFEWWFRFRPDTQKYIWWHPVDHISSEWIEGTTDTHVGSIHVVEEIFLASRLKSCPFSFEIQLNSSIKENMTVLGSLVTSQLRFVGMSGSLMNRNETKMGKSLVAVSFIWGVIRRGVVLCEAIFS